jgi:hypothetical protein
MVQLACLLKIGGLKSVAAIGACMNHGRVVPFAVNQIDRIAGMRE